MKRWGCFLLLFWLVACARPPAATPAPSNTPQPTNTAPAATATLPPVATTAPTSVPTATSEPTVAPPTATATEVPAFVFSSFYGGGPAGQWDRANFDQFLSQHPELHGELRPSDYYNAFVNRTIHRQLTSDDPPDVVSAALGGVLYEYASQGVIADISDLWAEQGWAEQFPASVMAMATVNGRQYFVPQAIQWNGIFYRTDVMAAAGVAPPTTWAELLAACDALNAAGYIPFAMTATGNWPPPMGFWFTHINQRLNGPAFHEQLMRGEISYSDPRVLAVFDYYGQLIERGCFDDAARRQTYGGAVSTFESGWAAMYAHGEWLYEFIDDETKAVTDLIRFPIIDESVPVGELVPMYGAFMLADTPYPEAARDFLAFVGGVASQQSNMEQLRRLPSNLLVDRSGLLPVYEKGLTLVSEAETLTQLLGANTNPDVATAFLAAITQFWREPENIGELLADVEAERLAAYGPIEPAGSTQSPPTFVVAQEEPVVAAIDTLGQRVAPGAALYHEGKFHLFLNRFDSFPGEVTVHYATSTDGHNWVEAAGEPILTTAAVPFAEVAAVAADVLVEPDGTWVLFFHTWQTYSLVNGAGVIGRATAPGPQGPWTVDPEPLLTMAADPAAWDGGQVSIADVVRTADGYLLYYTGASPAGLMQ
ncbi:MAG: extracellular solute-binding protein, partial [Anaerolineales bacterium]|nr:extracellular solute-binding protein [Anaerolineales bacterium]